MRRYAYLDLAAAFRDAAFMPGTQQSKLPPAQATMIGLSIFSADSMMGSTSVLISPGDLRWRGDGVELRMVGEQVRSVLQGLKR